ncbi:MAG: ester cyclase [Colwellia sp.]|nr:ester cyclase [Colwellia sp.]
MKIVKLVSVFLFVGIAACNNSNNDPSPKTEIAEESPEVLSIQPCISTACEENNITLIKQIYNDVINGANAGLVTSLYAENFIQHNSAITPGLNGQQVYFDNMNANYPNHVATIKHIVADGNYVAVHWHYSENIEDEFVGDARVDLYKLSDDLIVEHWDLVMTPNTVTASGNSVFSDLYIYPTDTFSNNDVAIEEENKVMVTEFYLDLFNNQNIALIAVLVDPSYLQHNFWVPNGSNALLNFVSSGTSGNLVIFLSLAQGDMVWTFSGSGDDNLNGVDLWRVDNNTNKIVEHWDIF